MLAPLLSGSDEDRMFLFNQVNQFLRFHTEKEYCLPDLAGEDVWPFVSRDGAHSLTQIAIPQKENNEPHITPDNPDPNLP